MADTSPSHSELVITRVHALLQAQQQYIIEERWDSLEASIATIRDAISVIATHKRVCRAWIREGRGGGGHDGDTKRFSATLRKIDERVAGWMALQQENRALLAAATARKAKEVRNRRHSVPEVAARSFPLRAHNILINSEI